MTDTQVTPAANPAPVDMELRTSQYIKLRDQIKAIEERHKEELKKPKEVLAKLEAVLATGLKSANAQNISTSAGTVYFSTRVSAKIKDGDAFWNFVVTNEAYELIDKRANAPAITDYLKENSALPPGIDYSTMQVVGVRRK